MAAATLPRTESNEPAGADFSLPSLDLRALARRAAIPAALAAVLVAIVVFAGGPMHAFADALQLPLGGAAATRLLPTAGVGGAALTLWALKRAGLSTRDATGTLLSFLVLLYSVFLGSILAAGTYLAATGEGPLALTALPAAGAALGIAIPL